MNLQGLSIKQFYLLVLFVCFCLYVLFTSVAYIKQNVEAIKKIFICWYVMF